MQLAWARLRDAASFAWILLLMSRLSEGRKALLECDHGALFNANEMDWVSGSWLNELEEYDFDKVGFLVQPGFSYGGQVSKMLVFPFRKNLYTP